MPKGITTLVVYTGSKTNPYTVLKKELKTHGIPDARDQVFQEAHKLAAMVQEYIFDQKGGKSWPPLNAKYLASKIAQGLDERKLIAYGDYVSEIKARKKAGGSKIEVGLPDEKHPTSGLSYKELGRILEYGQKKYKRTGKGIPPRPHWRPAWMLWLKRIDAVNNRIQRRVDQTMKRRMARQLATRHQKLT